MGQWDVPVFIYLMFLGKLGLDTDESFIERGPWESAFSFLPSPITNQPPADSCPALLGVLVLFFFLSFLGVPLPIINSELSPWRCQPFPHFLHKFNAEATSLAKAPL